MCPYPRKLNVKPYLSELIYNKSNHAILIHVDNIKRMTIPYPGTSIHIYAWSLHLRSSISMNIDSYICLTIPFLMSQVHSRDIAFNLMIFAHKSLKACRKEITNSGSLLHTKACASTFEIKEDDEKVRNLVHN